MPGTPATSPRFGAPRYANSDAVDFAGQVNGVTDIFDLTAARFASGTFAARPAAPADRTWYWATDRSGQADQLSVYVGGAWSNVPAGQVGTAEIQDAAITAAKMETQQAWQTLSLSGNAAGQVVRYYKDSLGFVQISPEVINVTAQTAGHVIGTFPAGYRPGTTIRPYKGALTYLTIGTNGQLTQQAATSNTSYVLSGWRAEA
jgi:hypothetical protein